MVSVRSVGGPLEVTKGRTEDRQDTLAQVCWPGIYREVENYCAKCPECRKSQQKGGEKLFIGSPFTLRQWDQINRIEEEYRDVFCTILGQTQLVNYVIETNLGEIYEAPEVNLALSV